MASDWIRLHRKILDSAVFSDFDLLGVWIWCLCRANWKDGWFGGEVVKAGSFVTGRKSGSNECGLSESAWYRRMSYLARMGMISQKTNSKWTTVTICNWDTYQNSEDDARTAGEQRANNARTASGQPADTIEEGKEGKEREEEILLCPADAGRAVKARKPAVVRFEEGDLETAQWMFGKIEALGTSPKTPNLERWATDIRLMRERDGRTDAEIRELFGWANQDGFWSANILSPAKLRDKWTQLKLKMKGQSDGRRGATSAGYRGATPGTRFNPEHPVEAF